MEKSFFIEVKNKLNIEELKKNIKELREKIIKCLDEERKTNVKLDKKLYEVEMVRNVIKDTDLKFGYPSVLHDLIWLYSSLMDVDRKMEYVNLVIDNL